MKCILQKKKDTYFAHNNVMAYLAFVKLYGDTAYDCLSFSVFFFFLLFFEKNMITYLDRTTIYHFILKFCNKSICYVRKWFYILIHTYKPLKSLNIKEKTIKYI